MNQRPFSTSFSALASVIALGSLAGCVVDSTAPESSGGGEPESVAEVGQGLGCGTDMPAIEIVDFDMRFVPPPPGAAPTVSAVGMGLNAGTVAATPGGLRLSLRAGQGGPKGVPAAAALVQHVGATGSFKLDLTSLASSTSTFITPSGSKAGLANYSALIADLYPGVRARVTGTLRKLTTTYTVKVGASPSTIAFSYGAGSTATIDPLVGSVTIGLPGVARTFSLGPPTASQMVNGAVVPVSASYVTNNGVVSLALGAYKQGLPLTVTTELLHSPHFTPRGHRDVGGYRIVADSSVRVTQAAQSTGEDVYLALVDPATGGLGNTTFLVGEGTDEAFDCDLTANGEILLAGRTSSKALPLVGGYQPQPAGGVDGFVARLAPGGTAVLASTYLGTSGTDSITGVTEDPNGGIVLVGTSSNPVAPKNPQNANFVSVLPPKGATQTTATYVVTSLSAGLDTLSYVAPVTGSTLTLPRVYVNCQGVVFVGMPALASAIDCTSWPDLQYTMRQYGKNYFQDHDFSSSDPNLGYPPGGYGYHALRWRFFEANDPLSPNYVSGGVTLSWAPVFPNVPKYSPAPGDGPLLNTLETQAFTPPDPPGGWAEGWSNTVEHLAMTAAYGEWALGTPVYADYTGHNYLYQPYIHGMGIERTTWDVCVNTSGTTYTGQGLDQLCSFATSWIGTTACSGNYYSGSFYVKVSSLEMTYFGAILIWFAEHQTNTAYPTYWYQQWFNPTRWIADPPDSEPQWAAKADEIASRLSPLVITDVDADVTTFTAGVPTSVQPAVITVRAADTH